MVNFLLCDYYLNSKKNANFDFVLIKSHSLQKGDSPRDLIDHYEQKKKEVIKNREKLGF